MERVVRTGFEPVSHRVLRQQFSHLKLPDYLLVFPSCQIVRFILPYFYVVVVPTITYLPEPQSTSGFDTTFVVRTGFEPVTIASLGFPSFAGYYTISDFRPTHSLLYRYCISAT